MITNMPKVIPTVAVSRDSPVRQAANSVGVGEAAPDSLGGIVMSRLIMAFCWAMSKEGKRRQAFEVD
jgi:hypothetical protein